jgi:predicted secreted Zn-dependent protease
MAASAIAIAAAIATPAAGELVHTTLYHNHPVKGTTPRALLAYMNAHPIIDPDDGPAYANLTHEHTLALTTESAAGRCRVKALTFRWRFVVTLPMAVDEARMSGPTKRLWRDFVAGLKRHEETHRSIFLDCGARFVSAAERLTAASCTALERQVHRTIDSAYDRCMARQRAFEARDRPRVLGLGLVRAARGE